MALVAMVVLSAALPAHAEKPRLVVNEFSGPDAKRVRSAVIKSFAAKAEVKAPNAKVREELAGEMSDQRMAILATEVGFDALVNGKVKKQRRKYELVLTIRAGINGAEIKHFVVPLGRKPRLSARSARQIGQAMDEVATELATLVEIVDQPPDEGEGEDNQTEDAAQDSGDQDKDAGKDEDKDADTAKDTDAKPADQDKDADKGKGVSDAPADSGASTRPKGRAAWAKRRGASLALGASMMGRRLTFQGLPNEKYSGPPTPAASVRGDVYPAALLGSTGIFSNLGIAFEFARTFVMNTTALSLNGENQDTGAVHQNWMAGVHYRLPLGKRHNSTTITLGGGYGERVFSFDVVVRPEVHYRMFMPGLGVRVPIGGRVALHAQGDYLLIQDVGVLDDLDHYGTAAAFGGQAEVGATVWITSWLVLHAGADYMLVQYTFDGNGQAAQATKARDEYYAGYLRAGLRF